MPPMKTVFVAAVTVVGVAALLWHRRSVRRARGGGILQDPAQQTETMAIEGNEADVERQSVATTHEPVSPSWPEGARERREFVARLDVLYLGNGESRLRAMGLARQWGHPSVLPLVRRGLRDVSPAVMREAAAAMESFRGPSPTPAPAWTHQPLDGRIPEQAMPGWRFPNPLSLVFEKGFRPRNGRFLPRDQPNSPPRSVARTR
jgi:hypothetical protein